MHTDTFVSDGRAQLEAAWPAPPETRVEWMCAGYPLLSFDATGDDARNRPHPDHPAR